MLKLWRPAATVVVLLAACSSEPTTPIMWTVKAEGKADSYLLGTIHLGVAANKELPAAIWDAFGVATTLVVETDVRLMDPVEYRKLAYLPPDTKLQELVTKATWDELLRLFPDAMPAVLNRLRPWAARLELFRLWMPTAESMDLTFIEEADVEHKSLIQLETWQEQFAPIVAIPLAEDGRNLDALLLEREAVLAAIHRLVAAYRAGDWEGVQRHAVPAGAVPAASDPFYGPYMRDRNRAWLPALEAALAQGGAFVAVGFGHLMNSDGLLAELQSGGFTVVRY